MVWYAESCWRAARGTPTRYCTARRFRGVIAWWDYGYQITGIAKRTSLADGNTWSLRPDTARGFDVTRHRGAACRVARWRDCVLNLHLVI